MAIWSARSYDPAVTMELTYIATAAAARKSIPRVLRLMLRLSDRRSAELGEALGWSRASLSDRLTGKTRITSDELAACAAFFGVEPGVFYQDPDTIRRRILGADLNSPTDRLVKSAGQEGRGPGAARAFKAA